MSIINSTLSGISDQMSAFNRWDKLSDSQLAFILADLCHHPSQLIVLLVKNTQDAHEMAERIQSINKDTSVDVFPDWETLAYDQVSPHPERIADRINHLNRLATLKQGLIIASIPSVLHQLAPKEAILNQQLNFKVGQVIDRQALEHAWVQAGYQRVEQVIQAGEFAVRGSILDLFATGQEQPIRIECFDDTIEQMRIFDVESQQSVRKIEEFKTYHAREYPLNEESIRQFRQAWRQRHAGNPMDCPLYTTISDGRIAPGAEYSLALFYPQLSHYFDYLPKNSLILYPQETESLAQDFWQSTQTRYEQYAHDRIYPILKPSEVFIPANRCLELIHQFKSIRYKQWTKDTASDDQTPTQKHAFVFEAKPIPAFRRNNRFCWDQFLEWVTPFKQVVFVAESLGRQDYFHQKLRDNKIEVMAFDHWENLCQHNHSHSLITLLLDEGFYYPDHSFALITEDDLYGSQVHQYEQKKRRRELDPAVIIKDLSELTIGDPVVHIRHGIGRYHGLECLKTERSEADYIHIEYANNERIYVAITDLHLISRYTGLSNDKAPLHQLGSKKWQQEKEKAEKKVRDTAAELLALYSEREQAKGYAFEAPNEDFFAFKQAFPFEETPDQHQAIDSIIENMMAETPMDHLVCGDVGFGKTEVAMQAAFLAVQNHKQVVVLVPTTLLCNQHLSNFRERFAAWPIRIEALSRFQSSKASRETIEAIKLGQVDIVIGTHKLISQDIDFKRLGLFILDEEHRFGVKQKERIKNFRAHIDVLTLTATPIPRTLQFAMAKMRDLSLITTPPKARLSIQTFIRNYRQAVIEEAIQREIMRGGQCYYLHNEVATIDAEAERLKSWMPHLRIAIAHGQMGENQLEKIMVNFCHRQYDILLCTTIVESGIDVPTANTIIINRADRFGLAQLHQLRGRVGRSNHQAYAYLLIPSRDGITPDARKRLDAINTLQELGSGFLLANHDLEIRGAGEILGEGQSGHMDKIGFSLYMELLEEAIERKRKQLNTTCKQTTENISNKNEDESSIPLTPCEIELPISMLFPSDYVADVGIRLSLYQRLGQCHNQEDLDALRQEIIDRFGALPQPALNLLDTQHLKQLATSLGIKDIRIGQQYGLLIFQQHTPLKPEHIIDLIQQNPGKYRFKSANSIQFVLKKDRSLLIEDIRSILNQLNKKRQDSP